LIAQFIRFHAVNYACWFDNFERSSHIIDSRSCI
jgi:hypothetical protein